MKQKLDMDKIAKGLGVDRRGEVRAGGGYFGAMQLVAEDLRGYSSNASDTPSSEALGVFGLGGVLARQ